MGAFLNSLVVLGLVLEDQAFHRDIGEQGIPAGQDQALPEPSHAAVAVGEGVDELEFIVKDRAGDERVGIGGNQPFEQITDQRRHSAGGRGHVNHLLARHHSHTAVPVDSRPIDQAGHENPMCIQQIFFHIGLPAFEPVVGGQGVFHLLHLARRGDDPLALQDRGNLRLAQGVALDSQRAVNGANTVEAPQPEGSRLIGERAQPPDGLADRGDPVQDLRGYGVGRLKGGFGHAVIMLEPSGGGLLRR